MKKSSIIQAAARARAEFTNTTDVIKLLQQFADKFNISYTSAGGFSLVHKKDEGKYLLTFPNRKSPSKFRLLIGEAIAAIYLGIDNLSGRAEAATAKADCHAFAMEFFLPEKVFIKEVLASNYNKDSLAETFKVETSLVHERIAMLRQELWLEHNSTKEHVNAALEEIAPVKTWTDKVHPPRTLAPLRKELVAFIEKDNVNGLKEFFNKHKKDFLALLAYTPRKLNKEINVLHSAAIYDAKKCFSFLASVVPPYLFLERFPYQTIFTKENGITFTANAATEGFNSIEMAAALGDIQSYIHMRQSINTHRNFELVPGQDSCAQFFAMQGNIGQLEKLRPEELHHEGENGRTALDIALDNPAGLSQKAKGMFVDWLERNGFVAEEACLEAANG